MFDELPQKPFDPFAIPSSMQQQGPGWAQALQLLGATFKDIGSGGQSNNSMQMADRMRAQSQALESMKMRQKLAQSMMSSGSMAAPAAPGAPQITPMMSHESPMPSAGPAGPAGGPQMDPMRQLALMQFVQDGKTDLLGKMMPDPMSEYQRAEMGRNNANDARAAAEKDRLLREQHGATDAITGTNATGNIGALDWQFPDMAAGEREGMRSAVQAGGKEGLNTYYNAAQSAAGRETPDQAAAKARAVSDANLPNQRTLLQERETAREHAADATRKAAEEAAQYDMNDPADASVIDAIGTYRVRPASSGRNPMQRKAQLAAVLSKYPGYSEPKFEQVNQAMKAFGTGKQGDIARSLNVSVAHLEALRDLGRALGNGDVNVVNAAKQRWQEQFGSPAPTNFDTARSIVADEVAKGVIGGVTAQQDREKLAASLLRLRSGGQIEGSIDTLQSLLGGQLGGLRDQYKRATTLNNFDDEFLSDRTRAALASRVPGKGVLAPGNQKLFDQADSILRGGR